MKKTSCIKSQKQLFFGVVFLISLFLAKPVRAADTLTLDLPNPLQSQTQIEVRNPITLPRTKVIITGYGEPGSKISVQARSNTSTIYTIDTSVDKKGQWQVTLPELSQVPDHLLVSSQTSLSPLQTVESSVVMGATVASVFVILQLIADRFLRLIQASGLLSRRTTKGFVFNEESRRPVAFVMLTIESIEKQANGSPALQETVVSTVDGLFQTINLPPGKYRVSARHPDYQFPTSTPRPWYASPLECYHGEIIEMNEQNRLNVMLIPLKPINKHSLLNRHWFDIRVLRTVLSHLLHSLSLPMGCLSMIFVVLYPSIINFVLASMYGLLGASELLKWRQNRLLAGIVTNERNDPVADVVVRIIQTPPEELVAVLLTNRAGRFRLRLPREQYHILFSKADLIPVQAEGMSFEVISLKRSVRDLHYRLKTPEADPS